MQTEAGHSHALISRLDWIANLTGNAVGLALACVAVFSWWSGSSWWLRGFAGFAAWAIGGGLATAVAKGLVAWWVLRRRS